MKKITIIDYGCGNLLNLIRAIKFLGYEVEATNDKKKIINSSNLILPGVGAFGNAMQQLDKHNLQDVIKEYVKLNKPLLGICLGMQVLFSESHEFGVHKGLNLIKGSVIKISSKKPQSIKVPHTGWHEIPPIKKNEAWECKILKKSLIGKNFYFVHSYVCLTKNKENTVAFSNYYDISIPAVVSFNNVYGCQFHPEKSADSGLIVLNSFCEI